jgi:hypothetical protein
LSLASFLGFARKYETDSLELALTRSPFWTLTSPAFRPNQCARHRRSDVFGDVSHFITTNAALMLAGYRFDHSEYGFEFETQGVPIHF